MIRRTLIRPLLAVLFVASLTAHLRAAGNTNANRLTYLDESEPFYVGLNFPKLITPQWVGESGVEAVVILSIDDLREPQKYESFLRPILERLKQIDGRAPVSIFCTGPDPQHPQFQAWLKEGLSLEAHTLAHPCPFLAKSNFTAAADTYHGCVDLLNRISGNQPVAFRMPCCDSINSPSPRFYAEIFNRTNPAGQFLTLDSSVMNITTPNDGSLPRELVSDADGREKFRKYIPFPSFVTTIEDYPYPYVIGKLCWEFPPMVPSDWEAQNIQKNTNPITLLDWKAALDAAVLKRGTFSFVFHPHGWSSTEQFVEFIDYAVARYGRKVKFLNFREAQERLNQNLLAGHPLRAANGQDNGVRLIDLNNDGYLDVLIGNQLVRKTRVWNPQNNSWNESDFPAQLVTVDAAGDHHETGVRFGVLAGDGYAAMLTRTKTTAGAWRFEGKKWVEEKAWLNGLEEDGAPIYTSLDDLDRGVRLRDVDRDGVCEFIVGNESQRVVFAWSATNRRWQKAPWSLPPPASIVDAKGRDQGLRFIDINEDGFDDVIFSNEERFALHLYMPRPYLGWAVGWTREVMTGKHGEPGEIPMIVRAGPQRNNGVWFHSQTMWVQNEDTAPMKNHVDRRAFKELLAGIPEPPKSAKDSLRCLRVRPGFAVELVAQEPLVMDPVAFDWGADGKLWVVEMADYPLGLDGKGKPGGRVRFLEDIDGDGRYDKSTVFLEGLNFPNGIMAWRNGVLVSAAPDVFYAADTNGDGKADVRKTLLTGFGEGNQQHRMNGFEYGLDNWVYGANGDSGGNIRSLATGKELNISGRDFRFRPDDGALETQAGGTQFGRHRDDWGNWFGNNNSAWLWHYVVPEQYIARNPHYAVRSNKTFPPNYPNPTRVYPIARLQQRFNFVGAPNSASAANSATPYRDELFGPEFATSVFISDPSYNLVHREVLEADGVTFTSHRAPDEQEAEFLASSDTWFRPTMLKTGPDGALYVADMYRFVIEHPEWIPTDVAKAMDLRAGQDQGRIYRVFPAGAKLRPIPRLDRLDTAGLVAALESPNGWQRDTAQHLLVQKQDPSAVEPLKLLSLAAKDPKVRMQSLCTLDGLHALTPEIIMAALRDAHFAVRERAVRLSESLLAGSPALGEALLPLVKDPALRVRHQLAFTLGEWDSPKAGRALGELAVNNANDPHLQTAVMTSAARHLGEMLVVAMQHPQQGKMIEQLLGFASAANDEGALIKSLAVVAQAGTAPVEAWRFAAVAGFLDSLDRHNTTLGRFQAASRDELRTTIQQLEPLFAQARRVALDTQSKDVERLPAVRLLGRGITATDADLEALGRLLGPQNSQEIQRAALANLGRGQGEVVADVLLAAWGNLGPLMRGNVLDLLLSRSEWMQRLLGALEEHKMSPGALGIVQQQRLLNHTQAAIRDRAKKMFAAAATDRHRVVQQYEVVRSLHGDAIRGADLFRQNCAPCHRFHEEGNDIGADLGTVAYKPLDYLLTAILDPNQAVEARYTAYTAVTKNDTECSGIMVAQTATSITLRQPGGHETSLIRSDLKSVTSSGRSLMPEGFENGLNPQGMADLLAHITTASPPKNFAGNRPELVRPDGTGALRLLASNCEIHGDTLVFEDRYKNLGYWQSESDCAVWSVEVSKGGAYDVWLDWAAPGDTPQNSFRLEAGSAALSAKIPGSGSWDTYRQATLGRLELKAGRQLVVVRAEKPVNGAIVDLRELRLQPAGQ